MKKLLKYFCITLLIIIGITTTVLFYVEYHTIQTSKAWLEDEESSSIESKMHLIGSEFSNIFEDVDFLKLRLLDGLKADGSLSMTEEEWLDFSQSKPSYDQLRYIDAQGFEKIRINRNGTGAYLVDQEVLQFKGDRYYFSDSVVLDDGELYISPLDLNIEHGKVEMPKKPMIRFAMPVIDDDDVKGIVIVNYLAEGLLEEFRDSKSYGRGTMYLVNEDGCYLSSGTESKDFAFMFSSDGKTGFAAEFPEVWARVRKQGGKIVTDYGIFLSQRIDFTNHIYGGEEEQIFFKEDVWHIVSHIPSDSEDYYYLHPSYTKMIQKIFITNGIYFLFLSIVSFLIALLVYKNYKSYYQVRYLSEYDAMTGILNRRAGLNSLQELLRTYDERSGEMVLCYLDVDGLKQVNDNLGHEKGDELINTVVKVIQDVIRESDLFMRLGGDEFLLVLHHMDRDVHNAIWRRIDQSIDRINSEEKRDYLVKVSKGFASVSQLGTREVGELMKIADEAMYQEKEKHRGSVLK